MKTVEGFKMRPLGKQFIIVPEGLGVVNYNKIISLNSSAAYLWESVAGKDFTVEDLKNLLLEKYDVSEEQAASDAAALAQSWINAGIVTE